MHDALRIARSALEDSSRLAKGGSQTLPLTGIGFIGAGLVFRQQQGHLGSDEFSAREKSRLP
jgi:uncharacterized membrane protein YhiD involved in acid resistance